MKKTRMMTLVFGLLLACGLAWMIFLAATNSPMKMTVIPAAAVCGLAAIGLAQADLRRTEEKHARDTVSSERTNSRAA